MKNLQQNWFWQSRNQDHKSVIHLSSNLSLRIPKILPSTFGLYKVGHCFFWVAEARVEGTSRGAFPIRPVCGRRKYCNQL